MSGQTWKKPKELSSCDREEGVVGRVLCQCVSE
jgi:hypothetical protein